MVEIQGINNVDKALTLPLAPNEIRGVVILGNGSMYYTLHVRLCLLYILKQVQTEDDTAGMNAVFKFPDAPNFLHVLYCVYAVRKALTEGDLPFKIEGKTVYFPTNAEIWETVVEDYQKRAKIEQSNEFVKVVIHEKGKLKHLYEYLQYLARYYFIHAYISSAIERDVEQLTRIVGVYTAYTPYFREVARLKRLKAEAEDILHSIKNTDTP